MKTILITGGTGFIGKNLIAELKESASFELLTPSRGVSDEELRTQLKKADYIFHLAGVSRPQDPKEFYEGNSELTEKIVSILLSEKLSTPILYTSSIHAVLENDFGASKKRAEEALFMYQKEAGSHVYIVRLTNTFGRWAKPNAHSVVATFCYKCAHNEPIEISDPSKEMILAHVDDFVSSCVDIINGVSPSCLNQDEDGFYKVSKTYTVTLQNLADYIEHFKNGGAREKYKGDEFAEGLLEVYLSYKD
jgi:UDP-2-acetamido-2,6-beta-L-arabino-hexul-4-ose reductase